MIVFSKNQRKNRLRIYAFFGRSVPPVRRRFILVCCLTFFYLFSMATTVMIAQWMYRYGYQTPHQTAVEIKQFALKIIYFPSYLAALAHNIPDVRINMKLTAYEKLESLRELSLKRGDIIKTGDDFVPIHIEFNGKLIGANARFKGNALDNISSDKWALKIKVSGESMMGMKEFSLRTPDSFDEWIYPFYLFAVKREGIIVPRQCFVNVIINGVDKGLFGLEEEMRPELLSANGRKEGPILAFNEKLAWENWPDSVARHISPFINWQNSEIQIFGESKVRNLASVSNQADIAVSLLRDFRNGKLRASEVFDVTLLSRYLALNSLLGGGHSSEWRNIRFFYNPVTQRVEPIARDAGDVNGTETIDYLMAEEGSLYMSGALFPTQRLTTPMHLTLGTIHRAWFSDPIILEQYIRELMRISTDSYIKKLIQEAQPVIQNSLKAVRREKAGSKFDPSFIYANQKTIYNVLNPAQCIQARVQSYNQKLAVSVANLLTIPVELISFQINGLECSPATSKSKWLNGKAPSEPMEFKTLFLNLPPSVSTPCQVQILHRIVGTTKTYSLNANWENAPYTNSIPIKFVSSNLNQAQTSVGKSAK